MVALVTVAKDNLYGINHMQQTLFKTDSFLDPNWKIASLKQSKICVLSKSIEYASIL